MLSIQSPHSGEALVLNVSQPFIYNSRKNLRRDVSNVEIGIWLSSHGEVRRVEVESFEELQASLKLYYGCRKALQLALFSVDSDLDSNLQQQSIILLEPLLKDPNTFNWLLDLFCIQELPQPAIEIISQSLHYADQNAFQKYISFYTFIADKQSKIKLLANIWIQIEQSLVIGRHHQSLLENVLGIGLFKQIIDEGIFLKSLELILLVLLKARPTLDSDFIINIIPKSIDFNFFSNILGFKDTLFAMEELSLWSLVSDMPSALKFTASSPGQATPFE